MAANVWETPLCGWEQTDFLDSCNSCSFCSHGPEDGRICDVREIRNIQTREARVSYHCICPDPLLLQIKTLRLEKMY